MKDAQALEMFDLQETFNEVRNHLLKQNEKSEVRFERDGQQLVEGRYRGPKRMRCAAGVLIPDESYDPAWEGKPAHKLDFFHENFLPKTLQLIDRLQYVHDFLPTDDWSVELQAVADEFNLNP